MRLWLFTLDGFLGDGMHVKCFACGPEADSASSHENVGVVVQDTSLWSRRSLVDLLNTTKTEPCPRRAVAAGGTLAISEICGECGCFPEDDLCWLGTDTGRRALGDALHSSRHIIGRTVIAL